MAVMQHPLLQDNFFGKLLIVSFIFTAELHTLILIKFNPYPVGKITEKAVCRSVFLTTWHYIMSAVLKCTPSDCFLTILPTGY